MFARSAGVLLHPTSLPGRYGIGDLGNAAYEFVNFLVDAKQTLWQTLPLGPTGYGDSPYQCFSAFAGNPLLISPDKLLWEGYLPDGSLDAVPDFPRQKVDFGWVISWKNDLLRKAFNHFQAHQTAEQAAAFAQFCQAEDSWLHDFALFMALKNHHVEHHGGVWNTWPQALVQREAAALHSWEEKLAEEISYHKFLQFIFFKQWRELKAYANERHIKLIGDMPIFVAYDSADVWANPGLFHLDEAGNPTHVAGVPPDYFSKTGQRWGNPLYKWEKMAGNQYAWWASRLQSAFGLADIVRIDHFRGFEAYWEIPAEEPTAVVGKWIKAPGHDLFTKLEAQLGKLPIIAEDLGVITPEVEALRDAFNFPGMKILQFAFGGELNSNFLPHTYDKNCVVYTGSHDNETSLGWFQNASPEEKDNVRRYVARDDHDIVWDMIRLAYSSVAVMAVIPLQDLMVLGNDARMNFPGQSGGLWAWRYSREQLGDWIAPRLIEMAELYGRIPEENG